MAGGGGSTFDLAVKKEEIIDVVFAGGIGCCGCDGDDADCISITPTPISSPPEDIPLTRRSPWARKSALVSGM